MGMRSVKRIATAALDRIGVADRVLAARRRDIALLYHGVESTPTGYHWSVSAANFAAHLSYLERNVELVPLGALFEAPGHRSRAAITFDDAYADIYDHVAPLIVARRIPITVFVPTRFIEEGNSLLQRDELPYAKAHMSWAQMRELMASGLVCFESHTHSHLLAPAYVEQLGTEIDASVRLLEQRLGYRSRFFAYPYDTWNEQTNAVARAHSMTRLFGFQSVPIRHTVVEGRFDICRRNEQLASFKLTVAGVNSDALRGMLGAAPRLRL